MPCGVVLREALKHESIAAIILYDDSPVQTAIADSQGLGGVFWNFFTWIVAEPSKSAQMLSRRSE